MSDDALSRVLDRNNAIIRAIFADLRKHITNCLQRRIMQARAEFPNRRLVRKRRLRPEISDRHGFFQRQRARHDFPVNRPQRFIRDRPGILPANPLQHRPLAMRRINFHARLQLDFADRQHMLRALIQELHNLRVQLINGLPMFGNVQSECRMQNLEGRIKSDSQSNIPEGLHHSAQGCEERATLGRTE